MKKLFLLSLVAAMFGTASAVPAKQTVKAGEAKINKAAMTVNAAPTVTDAGRVALPRVKGLSVQDKGMGSVIMPKAYDVDGLFYLRPRTTFELAWDWSSSSGVPGIAMASAFAPLTWINKSDEGVSGTWEYFDMFSDEMQESTEADLVMTPDFTSVGYINHAPYLAASETSYFQDPHDMIYGGGTPTFNFSDGTSLTVSSVCVYDSWSDSIYLDSYNVGLNCVNYTGNYDELWTEELKEIYSGDSANISNARLEGLVQYIPAPAAPYIINNVRWLAYWRSASNFNLKFSILKQNEDGSYETIATASNPLRPQTDFAGGWQRFTLQTNLGGGLKQNGVVIDGPVLFMLHGFHDEGMDENVTNFLSPMVMMYSDYMEKTSYWDAGSMVSFDYNNDGTIERYTGPELIQGGYYWNYDDNINKDTVVYTSTYPICFDLEYPFIYSADSEFLMPNEGGEKESLVMSNQLSDMWEVTDENGEIDLPEWITIDFTDNFSDEDEEEYNDSTNVIFTVDPLPEGVEGRQAKILFCYPSFKAPAVIKEFVIKQGDVPQEQVFYMVGTFNSWSQQEGMLEFVDNEGVLEVAAELNAGEEFKLITPNGDGWTWYGGVDENSVGYFLINNDLLNVPLQLVDGSNFRLEKGGKYTFKLDPEAMTLTVVPDVVPGDVNGDGSCTSSDVTALYNFILYNDDSAIVNGDQNGDGTITSSDVTAVYNIILGL